MKKINNILKGGILAVFAVLVIAAPTFAAVDISNCKDKFPNLTSSDKSSKEFPVKCANTGLYGKSTKDCAEAATLSGSSNPCEDADNDLNSIVRTIIDTLIFVIGMVAVVMIILGGISYATSQGDPNKVKKGKDTILYGIIGLVISLLAFAIVHFVLGALN